MAPEHFVCVALRRSQPGPVTEDDLSPLERRCLHRVLDLSAAYEITYGLHPRLAARTALYEAMGDFYGWALPSGRALAWAARSSVRVAEMRRRGRRVEVAELAQDIAIQHGEQPRPLSTALAVMCEIEEQVTTVSPPHKKGSPPTLTKRPHGRETTSAAFHVLSPLKTLMSVLGMPSGNCRQPLGKMTRNGLDQVIEIARRVYTDSPEIFQPLGDFFNIDVAERLENPAHREGLYYESY